MTPTQTKEAQDLVIQYFYEAARSEYHIDQLSQPNVIEELREKYDDIVKKITSLDTEALLSNLKMVGYEPTPIGLMKSISMRTLASKAYQNFHYPTCNKAYHDKRKQREVANGNS